MERHFEARPREMEMPVISALPQQITSRWQIASQQTLMIQPPLEPGLGRPGCSLMLWENQALVIWETLDPSSSRPPDLRSLMERASTAPHKAADLAATSSSLRQPWSPYPGNDRPKSSRKDSLGLEAHVR